MKSNKLLWIISFIPLLLSCVVVRFLPDKIPMHYDMAGNIDRWGAKYETFIFPVIIIAFSLMWTVMIAIYKKLAEKAEEDKMRAEYESNSKVLKIVAICMALGFGIMHVIFTYSSYVEAIHNASSSAIDFNSVICVVWGVILIILGNFMPKAKRNSLVGFRTTKTLSDDDIWRKRNRFAGISLMIAGGLTVVQALLIGGMLATFIMLGIILVMTVVDLIYVARL